MFNSILLYKFIFYAKTVSNITIHFNLCLQRNVFVCVRFLGSSFVGAGFPKLPKYKRIFAVSDSLGRLT
jgi:hypothetical protein